MSDLLPLVVSTLKDKIAIDSLEEINQLRKERDFAHTIEIIRSNEQDTKEDADVVVYASGNFIDGKYSSNNPNLFEVTLKSDETAKSTCLLSDLKYCEVTVGGGFPFVVLDYDKNTSYEGWLNGSSDDDDIACVSICACPHTTWLSFRVRGWPRESWEPVYVEDSINPGEIVNYLVETIATEFPEATVEFDSVSFVANNVHGALKRLLPPRRKEDIRADRAELQGFHDETDLKTSISRLIRSRGDDSHRDVHAFRVNAIFNFFKENMHNIEYSEESITRIIDIYITTGHLGLDLNQDPEETENDDI